MTGGGEQGDAAAGAAKAALRSRLLAARAARSEADRTAAGLAIAEAARTLGVRTPAAHSIGPRPTAPTLVAAYLSVGSEPPTEPLLHMLADAGVALIVPVLVEGGDLDWARYRPGDLVTAGLRGTIQPAGPLLGVGALGSADVVFVPALAADRGGGRLGRGGGSYDRVLDRVQEGAPIVAVVYDDEVLGEVPMQAHDHRIDATLTPSGLAIRAQYPPS